MGVFSVEGVRFELLLKLDLVVLEKPELRRLCPNPLSPMNPLLLLAFLKPKLLGAELILPLAPYTPLKAGTVLPPLKPLAPKPELPLNPFALKLCA
jgi:hypothetical protein